MSTLIEEIRSDHTLELVNEVLESLILEKHPDKTFIGRAEHGFSFLGYQLSPSGISVAKATVIKMQEHIARLYEQGAGEIGIGQYVRQWVGWVFGGIKDSLLSWPEMVPYEQTSYRRWDKSIRGPKAPLLQSSDDIALLYSTFIQ